MKISYKEMESCCKEMDFIASKINEKLLNINNCLNRIDSNECWKGNGYRYYFNKFKKVTNTFEEVNSSINSSIRYLEQAAESYNSLDKKIIMNVVDNFRI